MRTRLDTGLTLPEIMVALLLASLVAIALFGLAEIQGLVQAEQQQTQSAQDNIHAAMAQMTTDLHHTGSAYYLGIATNAVPTYYPPPSFNQVSPPPTTIPAVSVNNNVATVVNGYTFYTDQLQLLVSDENTVQTLALIANQFDKTINVTPCYSPASGTQCPAQPPPPWPGLPTGPGLQCPNPATGFCDFFVLANFSQAILYQLVNNGSNPQPATLSITYANGAATSGTMPGQVFTVTPVPTTVVTQPFQPENVTVRIRPVFYAIDFNLFPYTSTTSPGTPVFYEQEGVPFVTPAPAEQIIAENIVDFQVAVGVDGLWGPPNGTLTEVGVAANDDEWVYNVPGETLPNPLPSTARVLAVRVSFVARTATPSATQGPGQPSVEDHIITTPPYNPDNFRYRVVTSTIAMRTIATN